MTPKEKSKELFLQYYQLISGIEWTHFSEAQAKFFSEDSYVKQAKQCAIICCDEMIKEIPEYLGDLNPKRYYWQSVKAEIQIYKTQKHTTP